jgi:hypothetical protein
MGTNCAPLFEDLFLFSDEAEFTQKLLHEKKESLVASIQHFETSTTFYLRTIINSIPISILICLSELEITDTTETS